MIRIAAALALAASTLAAQEGGETYFVGHGDKFVNISFESEADLETIVGHTNKAAGEVVVNAAKETGFVSLTVPVQSMKTGIDMRDEHLRSPMWLDEAKFAEIAFQSKKVEKVKDKPGRFAVAGDFTMHGVTKEISCEVESKELPADAVKRAKFPEGKWLKFTTQLRIRLSDHGVKIPDVGAGKVNDEWTVKITVFAGTAKLPDKK